MNRDETFHRLSDYEQVRQMGERFGHPNSDRPRLLDTDEARFRLRFMQEELDEYARAHDAGDLAGTADALVDLAVVVLGTAAWQGLPWEELFDEVMRANLEKVPGEQAKRGGFGKDLVKPDGWQPPRIEAVLARYEGDE